MKLKILSKGIHVTTSTGKTFSIQIGEHNYCNNNASDKPIKNYSHDSNISALNGRPLECGNAEVAVIRKGGGWATQEYFTTSDDVAGYVSIEEIFRKILAEESMATLIGEDSE